MSLSATLKPFAKNRLTFFWVSGVKSDLRYDSEIEVLFAADVPRRRHWSDADKLRIFKESFVGHRQVTATARRHCISRSVLPVWRRQYQQGELGSEPSPAFTSVTLYDEVYTQTTRSPSPSNPEARIEIALRNGRRLVASANVDPEALFRLLPVLERP